MEACDTQEQLLVAQDDWSGIVMVCCVGQSRTGPLGGLHGVGANWLLDKQTIM